MSIPWDNKHVCSRCQAMAHDIVREARDHALLECCFCGAFNRVPPLHREPPKPKAVDFRFEHGRYAGMTLEEVDADPHGRRYLEFQRLHSPALRGVIEAYLFQET